MAASPKIKVPCHKCGKMVARSKTHQERASHHQDVTCKRCKNLMHAPFYQRVRRDTKAKWSYEDEQNSIADHESTTD